MILNSGNISNYFHLFIRACRSMGLSTYTVDDKHGSVQNIHARANFCMAGVLIQAIALYFGHNIIFDLLELDYFFSPVIK